MALAFVSGTPGSEYPLGELYLRNRGLRNRGLRNWGLRNEVADQFPCPEQQGLTALQG
jgi:hypothetical protein